MSKVAPEPDVFRGRRVGKYQVLTRLSVGGMAELFLAFTAGPGGFRKFVALKQILPHIASDEAFVHMFLDEARITAALNHPNVGQVYELGEEEGQFYLAMEYIAGQNLEHILRRASRRGVSLPIGFSVKVIRDVCLGLNYAHSFSDVSTRRSAGIVHRDVSPKNIMVTYAGTVKVVDFGIAKARNRLNYTKAGMVKGTSGYMSPEQVHNTTVDARTDLFATAVVLYELLTGQRLFSANTDLVMMKKVAEGDIPHPQKLNAELSDDLCAVVLKGLERNVQKRFQNGREMARALEKAYPGIADEDKTASFMLELFPDKLKQAQALLESAGANDSQEIYVAVRALREEPSDLSKSPSRRSSASGTSNPNRTPLKPSPAESASTGKSLAIRPGQNLKRKTASSSSSSASIAARQRVEDMEEKTPVGQKVQKPSRLKPWLLRLVWLGLLAAGVWAVAWGPLHAPAKPYASKMFQWVKDHLFGKPVDVPPVDEPVELPDWLIQQRAEEARLAEEKALREERERLLWADPTFQKLTKDIEEQTQQMMQMEEEQNALKAAQEADRKMGHVHARRIAELEKQMAELSKQMAANRAQKAKMEEKTIQVVGGLEEAAKAGLGYFTLKTTNPTNAKVYFKNNYIGTTPLVDTLIEEGMQEFHLVGSDGRRRRMTYHIARGQKNNVATNVERLPLLQ